MSVEKAAVAGDASDDVVAAIVAALSLLQRPSPAAPSSAWAASAKVSPAWQDISRPAGWQRLDRDRGWRDQ